MNIHKIGQSCLVVEEAGMKCMFDPGSFTTAQKEVTGLDAIIITHAHPDHIDLDTFPEVLENNPHTQVITHSEVGEMLDARSIPWVQLEPGNSIDVKGVKVEAFDVEHHLIHVEVPKKKNVGYLLADTFFHPGDSYKTPPKKVKVLAVPLGAPWGSVGGSLDYAIEIAPEYAFPIHDGMLKIYGPYHTLPEEILPKHDIVFTALKPGEDLAV